MCCLKRSRVVVVVVAILVVPVAVVPVPVVVVVVAVVPVAVVVVVVVPVVAVVVVVVAVAPSMYSHDVCWFEKTRRCQFLWGVGSEVQESHHRTVRLVWFYQARQNAQKNIGCGRQLGTGWWMVVVGDLGFSRNDFVDIINSWVIFLCTIFLKKNGCFEHEGFCLNALFVEMMFFCAISKAFRFGFLLHRAAAFLWTHPCQK